MARTCPPRMRCNRPHHRCPWSEGTCQQGKPGKKRRRQPQPSSNTCPSHSGSTHLHRGLRTYPQHMCCILRNLLLNICPHRISSKRWTPSSNTCRRSRALSTWPPTLRLLSKRICLLRISSTTTRRAGRSISQPRTESSRMSRRWPSFCRRGSRHTSPLTRLLSPPNGCRARRCRSTSRRLPWMHTCPPRNRGSLPPTVRPLEESACPERTTRKGRPSPPTEWPSACRQRSSCRRRSPPRWQRCLPHTGGRWRSTKRQTLGSRCRCCTASRKRCRPRCPCSSLQCTDMMWSQIATLCCLPHHIAYACARRARQREARQRGTGALHAPGETRLARHSLLSEPESAGSCSGASSAHDV